MARKRNRYRELEQRMTAILIADAADFLLCLVASGMGITWLKVITAIIAILCSGLCLAYLYLTQELLRPRSMWMSVGYVAIILVLVVSLVLHYPSPSGKKTSDNSGDLGNIPAVGAITAVIEQ